MPHAYLKYNLYDSEGILLKTNYQSIDKQAKDAWQKLHLYEEVQQDGYVQLELGNGSKKPVWMDGISMRMSNAINTDSTALDTLANDTTAHQTDGVPTLVAGEEYATSNCDSDDPDCGMPQFPDYGEFDREGYWGGSGTPNDPRVYHVNIFYTTPSSGTLTTITGNYYFYTGGYVGSKYYSQAYYRVSTGSGGGTGGGGGGGGGGPQPIDHGDEQVIDNRYEPELVEGMCNGYNKMLELQDNHDVEQIGLLTNTGQIITIPWDGNTEISSELSNRYNDSNGNIVFSMFEENGNWYVDLADWSSGAPNIETYQVIAHIHTHPTNGNENTTSSDDKAFASPNSFFGSIGTYYILNEHSIVEYDTHGTINIDNNHC